MSFDKESVYDEQISPLMRQIIAICKEHQIPMVASFQFSEDGYCTSTIPFAHQSERMRRLNIAMHPERPVAFAITETPSAISIKRVS